MGLQKKCLAISLIWLLTYSSVCAQQSSFQWWLTYQHQASVTKRWGYTFDINHRWFGFTNYQPRLSAARLAPVFNFNKNLALAAGYAWFGNYLSVSPFSMLHEHRLWQQLTYTLPKKNWAYLLRFRIEERIRQKIDDNENRTQDKYATRLRWMLRMQGSLLKKQANDTKLLDWFLANEFMVHHIPVDKNFSFEQNRLIAGLAWQVAPHTSVQTGFQQVWQLRSSGAIQYSSIRLTLVQQFDFSKSWHH